MKNICRELWNAAKKLKVVLTIFLLLIVVALSIWAINNKATDKPTFFLTLIAFLAAAYAIWQQHKAFLEQQTLGAWQVLANKVPGNSGKKEAIEFLAKQGKSLRGIDMSIGTNGGQVYLKGLDVSKGTLWDGVDLSGAHFKGADLTQAHFKGVDLTEAHFEGANLGGALFEGAILSGTHFEGANLRGALFIKGAILSGTHFEGADLTEAHFERAILSGTNFEGAILFETHFDSNTKMYGTKFKGLISSYSVHFNGCKMVDADFYDTAFTSSYFKDSTFDGSDLCGVGFYDCDLTSTDFSGATNFNQSGAKNLNQKLFGNNYITSSNRDYLPKLPDGYQFEFVKTNPITQTKPNYNKQEMTNKITVFSNDSAISITKYRIELIKTK